MTWICPECGLSMPTDSRTHHCTYTSGRGESNHQLRKRAIEAESEVAVLRSRLEQADAENVRLRRKLAEIEPVACEGTIAEGAGG